MLDHSLSQSSSSQSLQTYLTAPSKLQRSLRSSSYPLQLHLKQSDIICWRLAGFERLAIETQQIDKGSTSSIAESSNLPLWWSTTAVFSFSNEALRQPTISPGLSRASILSISRIASMQGTLDLSSPPGCDLAEFLFSDQSNDSELKRELNRLPFQLIKNLSLMPRYSMTYVGFICLILNER